MFAIAAHQTVVCRLSRIDLDTKILTAQHYFSSVDNPMTLVLFLLGIASYGCRSHPLYHKA